ncbi:MAG TPA: hypothetical protein VG164_11315 [Trebonia sp.]|jgi:hypothetical protein|nr:hypothetical protein [Trebonia sp.]
MLDVRLFRNPRFSAASGANALAFFGLFGFIFLITQYFQAVRGYDPLHAGVATLPFAVITGGLSPWSPRPRPRRRRCSRWPSCPPAPGPPAIRTTSR